MAVVDISKGWRKYSKDEILTFVDSGILVCGSYELSDFIEYLIDEVEGEVYQKGYDAGWDEAKWFYDVGDGD